MKARLYENNKEILVVFLPKDKRGSPYDIGATTISKTCLGASCGHGFDDLKEMRLYIKKHKMKVCGSVKVKKHKKDGVEK